MKAKFVCILFSLVTLLTMTQEISVAQMQEMERVLERIDVVRLLKMTDALHLERERAAMLASISSKFCETRKNLLRNLRRNLDTLRQILSDKKPDDRELKEIVGRVKNIKKELANLKQQQMDDEMNLLTPEQQARYLIFKVDFHKEMHELIKDVRSEKKKLPDE